MAKTKKDFIVCERCGKTLYHNKRYCPLFSKTKDNKWEECVCGVHTCCKQEGSQWNAINV